MIEQLCFDSVDVIAFRPTVQILLFVSYKSATGFPARDSNLVFRTPSANEPGFSESFAGMGRFGREDGSIVL